MKKKALSVILVLAMILSVLPMSVFAEENIAEGEGWFIDEYACLHILEDIEIPDENEMENGKERVNFAKLGFPG